jgi:hypothetical protein
MLNNTSYKSQYLGRAGHFTGGIWVHNTINGYMLFNEAAYTYLRHGAGDGEGFDIDNASSNVHVYYNYAHHNEGGGILLCNNRTSLFTYKKNGELANPNRVEMWGDWHSNYLRNNVFYNNGLATNKHRSAFITTARDVSNFTAENNTVIMGDIKEQHIINCEDNVVSLNHTYRNNIFYSAFPGNNPVFANQTLTNPLFDGNLYHNIASGNELENQLLLSDDAKAITDIDPKFTLPATFNGLNNAMEFVPGLELVNYAAKLGEQLKYDMKGVETTNINYLGAFVK